MSFSIGFYQIKIRGLLFSSRKTQCKKHPGGLLSLPRKYKTIKDSR